MSPGAATADVTDQTSVWAVRGMMLRAVMTGQRGLEWSKIGGQ